jgi:hypothetical protein
LNEGIIEVVYNCPKEECSQKMNELLIYLNFNDKSYFSNAISLIKQELEKISTPKMKLGKLNELKNNYEQLAVKTGASYRPGEPSLKQQLSEWIVRQIEDVRDVNAAVKSNGSHYNLFLPLSIDELGCFLYLLCEAEIIEEDVNRTEFAEVLSSHISTKEKEKISAASLLNKMYKPKPRVLLSVRKKLEKLIELTKSE